ncbi:MAG: ABC transporter ATP-binding protein [Burkholderiaceae bacterium]
MTPSTTPLLAISPLLSIDDLRVDFVVGKNRVFQAVRGVTFDVPPNRTIAVVGESGSGKSVTAMAILRLLPDNARIGGTIRFDGRDLAKESISAIKRLRGNDISVIFQEPMTSLNPVFTVGNQVGETLALHAGLRSGALRARVLELLDEVGLPDAKRAIGRYPHELSGGQQQRVMIAIAIACNPRLLIADEPTTALDVTIQKQILDLIARLKREHAMSVLFITHDLRVVGEFADEVVVMQSGEVRERGTVAEIFDGARDPYTQALLACRPPLEHRPARLPIVADFLSGRVSGAHVVDVLPDRLPRPDGDVVLDVKHLSKSFRTRSGLFGSVDVPAVKSVSFSLRRGRTLGLVGESGSGKTTVGLSVMRLHDASAGEVWFEGRDLMTLSRSELTAMRRRLQIVFQNPYASLNPRFTVAQILLEPMRIHGIESDDAARIRVATQLLKRVGLPETALRKYPYEFSGGQRQRIAIARCLTMRPEVLICDESVSALDVSVQAQVLNLLLDLQDEFGLAYLFISHDLAVVRYIADDVMVMHQGEVVEIADSDTIYRSPQNPYTRRLLASIPRGYEARPVGVATR